MKNLLVHKYRPQHWKDVCGQEVTVDILQKIIQNSGEWSAFLFSGTRGTGKTTMARLLAKAFNCTNENKPCGLCMNCQSINQDNHPDVVEMDAASKTGVEDIREVIEAAKYTTQLGENKIFIIDEVHMLSKSAFNALLKIVEEPPLHVKFIFATTEKEKIPLTIVSRCLSFHLTPPRLQSIIDYLVAICKKENFIYEDRAVQYMASSSDSIREILFNLEKVRVFSDNNISEAITKNILGIVDSHAVEKLVELIEKNSSEESLKYLRQITENSNTKNLINGILQCIYQKMLLLHQENNISKFSAISRLWQIFLKGKEEMILDEFSVRSLEMLVIRACYVQKFPSPEKIGEYINKNFGANSFQGHSSDDRSEIKEDKLPLNQGIKKDVDKKNVTMPRAKLYDIDKNQFKNNEQSEIKQKDNKIEAVQNKEKVFVEEVSEKDNQKNKDALQNTKVEKNKKISEADEKSPSAIISQETLLCNLKEDGQSTLYNWIENMRIQSWQEGIIVFAGSDYAPSKELEKYLQEKTAQKWQIIVICN